MLLKLVIFIVLLFFKVNSGLRYYQCKESIKNPDKNKGGSCYLPDNSTFSVNDADCFYCATKLYQENYGNGSFYGNLSS